MTNDLCSNVTKELKLKFKRFFGLVPSFVEAAGEKLVEGTFLHSPILNSVKTKSQKVFGANSFVCRSYRAKTGRRRTPPVPEYG